MIGDLISQANQLKGMTDEALGQEASVPSGAVPPFLVLSELSRRQKMRQTYQSAVARRAPNTTVAQDLASPAMSGGLDALPGGVGSPAPGGAAMPPTGYASGGIVSQFEDALSGLYDPAEARRMAIIQAGLGIAAGSSPYPLQNIATGALPAVQSYAAGEQNAAKEKLAGLSDLSNIEHYQRSDDLASMEYLLRVNADKRAQQELEAQADPNSPQNQTTTMKDYKFLQTLPPDQQDQYQELAHPYATATNNRQVNVIQRAYASVVSQVRKEAASDTSLMTLPPDQQEVAIQQRAKARFNQTYPGYAQQMQELDAAGALATGDDSLGSGASATDPLGLGL